MSKLRNLLLKTPVTANTATPPPPPKAKANPLGDMVVKPNPLNASISAPQKLVNELQQAAPTHEDPIAPLPAGLNSLIAKAPKSMPGVNQHLVGRPRNPIAKTPEPRKSPTESDLAALANIDITLTNDVATWPDDMEGVDMTEPANQMRAMLIELSDKLLTDDVSHAMQRIMVFLHENPAMADTLLPEDIGLCVKALQASHGVVIAKKTANKKKTTVKKAKIDDMAADLADLGFDFGTL